MSQYVKLIVVNETLLEYRWLIFVREERLLVTKNQVVYTLNRLSLFRSHEDVLIDLTHHDLEELVNCTICLSDRRELDTVEVHKPLSSRTKQTLGVTKNL